MKIELSLADADSYAQDTLAQIRRNLGADFVVFGSYLAVGQQIWFNLRVQDTATREMLSAFKETGSEANLFELVSRAGKGLREKFGIRELSPSEVTSVRAALPSNPEAARLYAEGLARLRVFDGIAARDLFEKAVAAEPDHALVHSALAAAWSALGYDGRAREEAKKAFDLSGELSREERLMVEGRYREMNREWDKAIEIFQSLSTFFSDNLDYGLRLAVVQNAAGKSKDAIITLNGLRKLPAPTADDPRIDLEEAAAAKSLADFRHQQAAASQAIRKGSDQGARLLVARGRMVEGDAFLNLGEPKKASASWQEARGIFTEARDRGGMTRALSNIALVLHRQGDLAEARKLFQESIAGAREIGDAKALANALNNLATVLYDQSDLKGAREMHEEALEIRRKIGDKSGVAVALNNLANVLADQANFSAATKFYEESLAIRRETGERRGIAITLINIGVLLKDRGDLATSKDKLEEALAVCRVISNKLLSSDALAGLGDVLAAQGNLSKAAERYHEALAIRTELGEKAAIAQTRLGLAELFLNQGHDREAEQLARQAAAEFRIESAPDREAMGWAIAARALLAQRKFAEAGKAMADALAVLSDGGNSLVRLSVAITRARVRASLGQASEARTELQSTIAQAKALGLMGLEFEARLAMGEIDIKAANSSQGRRSIATLEQEARSKGFGLIARKAATLVR